MADIILIFGASGSGKTTLARALAGHLRLPHFDTDDFYWVRTDPPYQINRTYPEIEALLGAEVAQVPRCVMSGSVHRYPTVAAQVRLVVFLELDDKRRMDRLMAREIERYGDRLLPGGDMYDTHVEFMAWAASYAADSGDANNRAGQEHWMHTLDCPVLRLDADRPVDALVEAVTRALREKGALS